MSYDKLREAIFKAPARIKVWKKLLLLCPLHLRYNAFEITASLFGYMVIVLVLYENPSISDQLEFRGRRLLRQKQISTVLMSS